MTSHANHITAACSQQHPHTLAQLPSQHLFLFFLCIRHTTETRKHTLAQLPSRVNTHALPRCHIAPILRYGFVFTNDKGSNVMIAWGPPFNTTTDTAPIPLGASLTIVDALTGATTTSSSLTMTAMPVHVLNVPAAMVAQAKANAGKPLAWGTYDPATSTTVSTTMGIPGGEAPGNGLHMIDQPKYPLTPVPLPLQTWTKLANGNWSMNMDWTGSPDELARDIGVSSAVSFTIDPSFLEYNEEPINISAVVRRYADNGNAGFNLKYEKEGVSGPRGGSIGWNTVPGVCPGSNGVCVQCQCLL
jgi:hypothetical protein